MHHKTGGKQYRVAPAKKSSEQLLRTLAARLAGDVLLIRRRRQSLDRGSVVQAPRFRLPWFFSRPATTRCTFQMRRRSTTASRWTPAEHTEIEIVQSRHKRNQTMHNKKRAASSATAATHSPSDLGEALGGETISAGHQVRQRGTQVHPWRRKRRARKDHTLVPTDSLATALNLRTKGPGQEEDRQQSCRHTGPRFGKKPTDPVGLFVYGIILCRHLSPRVCVMPT